MAKKKIKEDQFQLAHKLVTKNLDIGYIHSVILGLQRNSTYDQLVHAVEPEIDNVEAKLGACHHQVTGKDTESLFDQFDSYWFKRAGAWPDAGFTLGIALGIRLAGGGSTNEIILWSAKQKFRQS